jgi:Cu/Ag efflux pump CusA
MTALTSGIALLPIVLSPLEPGRELLYPVASVIVGGLVTSSLLDLLLTPGVFWLFGRHSARVAAGG